MWRFRQVLSLLTVYFLWKAMFSGQGTIFGYTEAHMMTYILVASLLQSVVFASRSIDLAGVINSGDLSNILIKPWQNFWYWISCDIADKSINTIFSTVEISLIFILLRPTLALPPLTPLLLLGLFLVAASTFLYYLINYLFGLLGFWTPDIWAPRFLLLVVMQFTAGGMFPLDVLPQTFQKIIGLTPFPYLIFYPTQAVLGNLDIRTLLNSIGITLAWSAVFLVIVSVAWKRGLAAYGAEGK